VRIIGIDPGLNGGIAILDGTLQSVYRMPVHDGQINVDTLIEIINDYPPHAIVIEEQQAMPKQGVSSTFKTGMNYGILLGVVESLLHPLVKMKPSEWKKVNGLIGKDKEASRRLASELYPAHRTHFKLVRDDGVAEAALIARAYQIRYIRDANAS